MVDIEFDDEPSSDDVKETIERVRATGSMPRGIAGGRSLDYNEENGVLRVNFENLSKVLHEHRMFEEAKGFSSTQMDVLRTLEAGPNRMSLSEIIEDVNDIRRERNEEPLEKQTFQHHLRQLREKGLVEHEFNQYTYIGP